MTNTLFVSRRHQSTFEKWFITKRKYGRKNSTFVFCSYY